MRREDMQNDFMDGQIRKINEKCLSNGQLTGLTNKKVDAMSEQLSQQEIKTTNKPPGPHVLS